MAERILKWSTAKTPEEVKALQVKLKRKVLQVFHRIERPVLVGEVAIRLNVNLEAMTEVMDEMVIEGTIRLPTEEEIKRDGERVIHRYMLVGPVSATLGGDE